MGIVSIGCRRLSTPSPRSETPKRNGARPFPADSPKNYPKCCTAVTPPGRANPTVARVSPAPVTRTRGELGEQLGEAGVGAIDAGEPDGLVATDEGGQPRDFPRTPLPRRAGSVRQPPDRLAA